MNFQKSEGTPGYPEIIWPRGTENRGSLLLTSLSRTANKLPINNDIYLSLDEKFSEDFFQGNLSKFVAL